MRNLLLLPLLSFSLFAQTTPPPVPPPGSAAATAPAQPGSAAPPAMTPGEAYQYAMRPFNEARRAADDLTEADKWALGIGMARAAQQCERLWKQKIGGEDLLEMGKVCLFGQDFDSARAQLIDYLALPSPKAPEVGRLLLTRAFLGLHGIAAAESQTESLLSLFPYDASIHLAIDQVIDAAEASNVPDGLGVVDRLNEQQLPHILEALAHGGSLSGNGDSVDAVLLVHDALRCADRLRRAGKADAADKIVSQLRIDVSAPSIAAGASGPAIANALRRYDMLRQPSPVRSFTGTALPALTAGAPRPLPAFSCVIPLYDANPPLRRIAPHAPRGTPIRPRDTRTLVLIFSLAGPASAPALNKLLDRLAHDHLTPALRVIAVTSLAANIGVEASDPRLTAALEALRSTLPAHLPVYLVPDAQLSRFAVDAWPAAVLLDGQGHILWLNTFSATSGSIAQMEREMETPLPPSPRQETRP